MTGGIWEDGDPWLADDKFTHLVAGMALWAVLARWLGVGGLTIAVFVVALWAWEALELYRMARWLEAGSPPPWPVATDRMSWKDVVAGVVGGLLAQWLIVP